MARPSKIITKEDILRAQKVTRSNMAAARYLHVSYNHYKKYAKMYKNEDGVTLLEAHKNQAGEGIPKFAVSGNKEIPLMDLLEGKVPIEHFDPRKIKARLLSEGKLVEVCNRCNFSERRVTDQKIPIILNFIDGNKKTLQFFEGFLMFEDLNFIWRPFYPLELEVLHWHHQELFWIPMQI